ncbi:MAG: hypothetical protein H7098_13155, partial [Oligoflexus sp.]|nr:hypothetical protein [Pseudopedobacter sp.]
MRQLIKDKFNTKGKVGLSNLKIDANIDYRKNKITNDCIEADMMIGESETKAFQKELSDLRIETTDKSDNAMLKTLFSNNLLTFKDTLKYVFSLGLIFILLALSALTKNVIFSSL